ncbi:hypothetical protein EYR36_001968 [Pleurotus pulmonarius]|nr:hypothetical protein EYR36_001968 [Pleurotus pulmonarius]
MEETANPLPYELWKQISYYFKDKQLHRIMTAHRAFYDTAMDRLYREIDWQRLDKDVVKTLICMCCNPALALRVRTLHVAAPVLKAFCGIPSDPTLGGAKTIVANLPSQYIERAKEGLGKAKPETIMQVEKLKMKIESRKPCSAREMMETTLSNMLNIQTCTFNSTQVPAAAAPLIRVLQKTLSQSVRKLVLECSRVYELQTLVNTTFQLKCIEDLSVILRFHPDSSPTQRHSDQRFLANRLAPFVNALHPTLRAFSITAARGVDYSTFLNALDVFPHLHQLSLQLDFDDQKLSEPNALIQFLHDNSSQLTSVTLHPSSSSDSPWGVFPSRLESDPQIFSNLRSLTIVDPPHDLELVYSLIERSKNTMKCLRVEGCRLDLPQIRQLGSTLGSTPVVSLGLEVDALSPAVLDLLSKDLPRLESLSITFGEVHSTRVNNQGNFVDIDFEHPWPFQIFTSAMKAGRYRGWSLSKLNLESRSYREDQSVYQSTRPGTRMPTSVISPLPEDVVKVRKLLLTVFPRELLDRILDLAQYWPRTIFSNIQRVNVSANSSACAEHTVLTAQFTPNIPSSDWLNTPKAKLVKFTTQSQDQGSYKGCWSWFEASILRPDKDTGVYSEISVNGSQRFHVQNNVHVSRNYDTHEIEWAEDDGGDDDRGGHGGTGRGAGVGFVRALRPGDKIALIALAQYSGWANNVTFAQIEVYYSV